MQPFKDSPRAFLYIHSELPPRSTRPPNYCFIYTDLSGNKSLPVCFDYLIPTNRLYLPVLSPVLLTIRRFTLPSTNRFHLCVFSPGFICTFICQLICWSAYRQTHTKMNVPVNFDASGYNNEDPSADLTVYMPIDASVQKLSQFIFMYPFRITSTIYPSTQLLLYIYTYYLPGNKSTSFS